MNTWITSQNSTLIQCFQASYNGKLIMFNYSINLAWSDEDNCYVATVSEFPGVSAFGDTPEEAGEEARIAVKGFLKVYEEDGCPIPEPEILKPFSGQTRLRLPKSLHETLSQEALKE